MVVVFKKNREGWRVKATWKNSRLSRVLEIMKNFLTRLYIISHFVGPNKVCALPLDIADRMQWPFFLFIFSISPVTSHLCEQSLYVYTVHTLVPYFTKMRSKWTFNVATSCKSLQQWLCHYSCPKVFPNWSSGNKLPQLYLPWVMINNKLVLKLPFLSVGSSNYFVTKQWSFDKNLM